LALGVALTKMQKKVGYRMAATYYDKIKRFFMLWKMNTFDNYKELIYQKKARTIERLVRSQMGE